MTIKKHGCCLIFLLILGTLPILLYYLGVFKGFIIDDYIVRVRKIFNFDAKDSFNTTPSIESDNVLIIPETVSTNETVIKQTTINNKIYGWVQDGSKYRYYDNNGNQVRDAWASIDGGLYYFDYIGYLETNKWISYMGKEFYVDNNGKMLSNQWIDGLYYVGEDGAKLKNTKTPDGYYVDIDGKYIATNETIQSSNNMYSSGTEVVPVAQTNNNLSNIVEPSAVGGQTETSEKAKKYQLKSKSNYNQTVYLDNDKTCNIRLILPVFADAENQEVTDLNEATMVERDNIITELQDMANSMIEEEDYSTKYIRYITMEEGRMVT